MEVIHPVDEAHAAAFCGGDDEAATRPASTGRNQGFTYADLDLSSVLISRSTIHSSLVAGGKAAPCAPHAPQPARATSAPSLHGRANRDLVLPEWAKRSRPCKLQSLEPLGQPTPSSSSAAKAPTVSTAADSSRSQSLPDSAKSTENPVNRRRVNTSALGHGAYRALYLQSVEKAKCGLEVVEDGADDSCDLYFVVPMDREDLHQRLLRLRKGAIVNHFPGMIDVCEKVSFCRLLRQRQTFCPRISAFVPPTWILPDEYGEILHLMDEAAHSGHGPRCFIVKPEYGLQGHGIFIVRTRADLEVACSARQITQGGPNHVCQQYVANPLLLDGLKFDLRLYLVVTSLAPLEAWLCREGIARFCTTPYAAPTAMNINVMTSHLTNYSLNCKEEGFARTQTGASDESASKRLLSATLKRLAEMSNGQFCQERFWSQMEEISALILVSLLPVLAFTCHQYFPVNDEDEPSRCYHVLGLDILLDTNYWPWLMEVNSSPAMDIETAVPVPEESKPAASSASATGIQKGIKVSTSQPQLRRLPRTQSRSSALVPAGSSHGRKQLASLNIPLQGGTKPAKDSVQQPLTKSSSSPLLLVKKASRGHGSKGEASSQGGEGSQPALVKTSPSVSLDGPAEDAEVTEDGKQADLVKKKKKKRQSHKIKRDFEPEEPLVPAYTDRWGGYQPSKMRHRCPWPEICHCVAHSKPHQHATCDVDEHAKSYMMSGILRRLAGYQSDSEAFAKVPLSTGVSKVVQVMWKFVKLCIRLSGTRNGVTSSGLRKVLQATEDITARPGAQNKCRLGLHEIDFLTSEGGRHKLTQREHPASAKLALLPLFDMMVEVSRRCCDKDPALSERGPLERLEWLLEAVRQSMDAATPAACPSAPVVCHRRPSSLKPAPSSFHPGGRQQGSSGKRHQE